VANPLEFTVKSNTVSAPNVNRESPVQPAQVAMLVHGAEVYGIGTIQRMYASHWPEMTVVCLSRGPMWDWLQQRGGRSELVEGLAHFAARNVTTTLLRMPSLLRQARGDARRIHERLQGRGVHFVHTHRLPQQLIAGCMRRYGYQSVWQINNNMNTRRRWGIGRRLNHRLARWGADLLLPASDFIAANWRGCGVPMVAIRNAAEPKFDAPNELPLTGAVGCVAAGRMLPSKGHHVAVEAAIIARQAGCDVRLDVYGGPNEDNHYADQLRRTIHDAGMEDEIRLMGFCSDLRSRHQNYHLGLQCRIDPEPCSLWVCETLVDGLPVLASATGGTPELVADGVTGYLYPAGSASELARHLIDLCRNRELLQSMRQTAFARGRQSFTTQRFLNETLTAYENAAAGYGDRVR
jgi:glycosyltransferase involved in cell wall biosynthesis